MGHDSSIKLGYNNISEWTICYQEEIKVMILQASNISSNIILDYIRHTLINCHTQTHMGSLIPKTNDEDELS